MPNRTEAYWSRNPESLLDALGSGPQGLAAADAARRRAADGPNAVHENQSLTALGLFWRQLANPLMLILLAGAGLSLLLRDWVEAVIILLIVAGSSVLGFIQEFRASKAVAELRQRLALTVQARRDGQLITLPASALVVGDIIELAAGNLVPADGVILAATDFLVSESALTGEAFPVEKQAGTVPAAAALSARHNCVYLGTSVRSGTATVLIVATGRRTAFGAIAASLQQQAPETDFERGLRQFGYLLLRVMVLTVIAVIVANQLLDRPVVESLLFAMALAVGLSPELLPAIVSVTMAKGARAMAERGVIVRRLGAIENLGSLDVLCTDKTGTLTRGTVELAAAADPRGQPSAPVQRLAWLNARLETGIANPLDAAIVAHGDAAGLDLGEVRKIDEIPYDFIRRRLTIVVQEGADAAEHLIITKGAFNNVLAICTQMAGADGGQLLTPEACAALERYYEDQGRAGYRVLALAQRRVPARPAYGHDDEADMIFTGFLLFLDPPRPEAATTLREMAELGITVKIITGDNRHVAAHLAASVGLDAGALLTGADITRLDDAALRRRAEHTTLFVEVDPQQKERIVRQLRKAGHVVGYMGDGINDAPALHAADVGISVDGAVDVARESADIVLLQPDLEVLRQGVREGRRTFANTLKYIGITTSANFGNMISMALATPLLPFLPLAAKQILLNNLLSDLPSIAISTDRVDEEQIMRTQRWDLRAVQRFMVVFGLVSTVFDLLTFTLLLKVFKAGEAEFQTAWFLVSLLTELAIVLVLRTGKPAFRSRPGGLLLWTTVAVLAITFTLPWLAPLATLFGFVPLPSHLLLAAALIVLGYIAASEAVKLAWPTLATPTPRPRPGRR